MCERVPYRGKKWDYSSSSSKPSTSSGSGNEVEYHQTMDLVINMFSEVKKKADMDFQVSAYNEELKVYGDQMRRSRWTLCVQPREECETEDGKSTVCAVGMFLLLDSPCDVELMNKRTEISIIGKDDKKLHTCDTAPQLFSLKKGKRVPADFWGISGYIGHDQLGKKSKYLIDDKLKIRAEITYTVVSGGNPPSQNGRVSPAEQSALPEPTFSSNGTTDCVLISADGRRFRVEKQHISVNAVFAELLKKNRKSKEIVVPNVNGDALEVVLGALNAKKADDAELTKQVLLAAKHFGMDDLEKSCLAPFLEDFNIEKAGTALKFAKDNKMKSLREKVIELLPAQLETLTVQNAAKALKIAVEFDVEILKMKALDVVARNVMGFVKAGGFYEIASDPHLVLEVEEAASAYTDSLKADSADGERPTKRVKVSPES